MSETIIQNILRYTYIWYMYNFIYDWHVWLCESPFQSFLDDFHKGVSHRYKWGVIIVTDFLQNPWCSPKYRLVLSSFNINGRKQWGPSVVFKVYEALFSRQTQARCLFFLIEFWGTRWSILNFHFDYWIISLRRRQV